MADVKTAKFLMILKLATMFKIATCEMTILKPRV